MAGRNKPHRYWQLTCRVRPHGDTCHPGTDDIPAFTPNQLKLVLDLAALDGCKAELT